ncbi:DNA repair exonuclease subunit 2 protein [Rhizobium phage RHph_I46]|uniref:DNA repair exonuclease subunit 2 protein n=1 Tax=Rhizobium phage RHph_I1_9 TaxID=2509729 RepID=A0A7S5RJG1_9CAUD|nr:SbcC-like subunit of palindrome specific endonuclease [Rhizobium phage RHph_I1_9]QIG69722.1 DNA repair exonuclease subunit 2 protein [Rhizobium phage RHph_I46]QIG71003.1 DNA repair exonuclease subunit 2 protein [Rhizobium phage RHph_I9]QIG73589.1 DNA repair exonuclease subunit 2 protein [Rhizobium phage RHph_I1_9]QIG76342.1 DNA repair exonuclease subunit 2 protein [Rhizobium phage RHph_I34]
MRLHFKSISFKNFLSYGNQSTTIQLDAVDSTLVVAENGRGKTAAMIDSIFFALLGEAFRDIKKAQIPNSINVKDCMTELSFDLDGTDFLIKRGIKPDVFQVFESGLEVWEDMKASDKQKQLMDLLKLDKTLLTNLILISEENVPFMRLDGPSRRVFVERVLGLEIFTNIHNVVKTKIKALKEPYSQLKSKVDSKQELIQRLNRIIDNSDSPDQTVIDEAKAKLARIDEFLEKADPALRKIGGEINRLNSEMFDANSEVRDAQNEVNKAEASIEKFESGMCPTCGGEIHSDKIQCFQDDLTSAKAKLEEAASKLKKIVEDKKPLEEKELKGKQKVDEAKTQKWNLDGIITKEESKKIANVDDELDEATKELAELMDQYEDMKSDFDDFAELDKVLKSGEAKLPIINEYIPFFNTKINEHLERFGLQVFFELNSEFNETIRARYKDLFSYESFSRGQRERINFAILMTWRDIASKLSSLTTNLLIVDEFASKLDENGFETISKALGDLEANIFCIVPVEKPSMDFDRRLKITFQSGFSVLEEA